MEEIEVNGEIYIKKLSTSAVFENYVIVRTTSAGVFAGFLKSREGKEVILREARRIWYWKGAASLSQLAMEGTKEPNGCKFPCVVDELLLTETVEIISTTKKAQRSIEGVPIWGV